MVRKSGLLEQRAITYPAGKPRRFNLCNTQKEKIGDVYVPDVKGDYSDGDGVEYFLNANRKAGKITVIFWLPSGVSVCDCKHEVHRAKSALKRARRKGLVAV